jgi:hypothetical protein
VPKREVSEEEIADLRGKVTQAKVHLYEALADGCPGPHIPTPHLDGNPAWCTRCGRDNEGIMRKRRA